MSLHSLIRELPKEEKLAFEAMEERINLLFSGKIAIGEKEKEEVMGKWYECWNYIKLLEKRIEQVEANYHELKPISQKMQERYNIIDKKISQIYDEILKRRLP